MLSRVAGAALQHAVSGPWPIQYSDNDTILKCCLDYHSQRSDKLEAAALNDASLDSSGQVEQQVNRDLDRLAMRRFFFFFLRLIDDSSMWHTAGRETSCVLQGSTRPSPRCNL